MKTTSLLSILLTVALGAGCAGEPEQTAESGEQESSSTGGTSLQPPTIEEARSIVEGSQPLAQYKFSDAAITIPMRSQMLGDNMRAAIVDLERTGWIGFDQEGNVAITTKALQDNRFIVRQGETLDIVPVASKRFGEILDVGTDAAGDPYIDFSWGWAPNEIGASFQSGYFYDRYSGTYYGRAKLVRAPEGWRIYTIEEIDPPAGAEMETTPETSD